MTVEVRVRGDLVAPGTDDPGPFNARFYSDHSQYGIWDDWDGTRSGAEDVFHKLTERLREVCRNEDLTVDAVEFVGKKPSDDRSGLIAAKMWCKPKGETDNG